MNASMIKHARKPGQNFRVTRFGRDGKSRLAKIWGCEPEPRAMEQIANTALLPFIQPYIAVMADCHAGYGATIGSVIPTKDVVVPMAVGMDIGCGMIAVRTSLTREECEGSAQYFLEKIGMTIPHGRTAHGNPKKDKGAWHSWLHTPDDVKTAWNCHPHNLCVELGGVITNWPMDLAHRIEQANSSQHLGTLGTGNHFIELSYDENDDVWIVVHSGSRGIGGAIAKMFTKRAKELAKSWYIDLPDPDLAFFPSTTREYQMYLDAAQWAQKFADVSRRLMVRSVKDVLEQFFEHRVVTDLEYACHHNFIEMEHHKGGNVWVTRKGAVRARSGDKVVIPGSMGTETFLCTGKGNKDSLHSCSHGAGRVMSRTQARKTITVADHAKATEGVACRKDASVLDESPDAYKGIHEVMAAQEDLVSVDYTLKQFVCVKG